MEQACRDVASACYSLEQQRIVSAATCALVAVSNPLLEAAMSHAKASQVLPDAAALLAAFDTFALVSEHVQALSPVSEVPA